jgi:hypothetical protein
MIELADTTIREFAQSDPAPKLTARWGEATADTRRVLAQLVVYLRELDALQEQLAERDITVDINLGPIGNAAASVRRDVEKKDRTPKFSMPQP